MEKLRKPFQGVYNIFRFNRHFYFISFGAVLLLFTIGEIIPAPYQILRNIFLILIIEMTLMSLIISFYIYDLSGIYKLDWLKINIESNSKIININAGFDETSSILKNKFPDADLNIFDFYDPLKNTEVSIKRARKAYPQDSTTVKVNTSLLPLENNYADIIFVIFSAHEIRDENERIVFFRELNRILKTSGQIIIIEHIRNLANLIVYNAGFLHFFSTTAWFRTFKSADFIVSKQIKFTPFINAFFLQKNGNPS